MGRSAEITRDEVKFFKFIERLRNKFSELFQQLLRVQLVLKGIITEEDWQTISDKITYRWLKDSHFTELKDGEVMRDRLDMLSQIDDYIGKYYSIEWVRKNILQQSEEDIKIIDGQMQSEDKQGAYGEEEGDY